MSHELAVDLPKPRRRWFRYSLRTLLILVTLFSVFFGALAHHRNLAISRQAFVEEIQNQRGVVTYDYELGATVPPGAKLPFPGSPWARKLLWDDYFANIVMIRWTGSPLTDAQIAELVRLTQLSDLALEYGQLTDHGLARLRGLVHLKNLDLANTPVSDAGLIHLQGMRDLEVLVLGRTQVRDDGLIHLQPLKKLKSLNLEMTQVSDAGLEHLQTLTQLEELDLRLTQVSDAGLIHLQKLVNLKNLRLHGARITNAGIAQLQKSIPKTRIQN